MTALSAPNQPARPGASRRGATWMRRIGSLAVTMALIVLGLGAGLWLGSPASADTGDIQVHMDDDTPGVFSTSTPKKLLDMSALAPGGSVSGHMLVLDASNSDGTSKVDSITLMAMGVTYGDTCPLPAADCLAASHKLAEKLSFEIVTSGPGNTGTSTTTLAALETDGVVIGSGMGNSNTLDVTVTASLDKTVGNDVQYGSVTFNLGLALVSASVTTGGGDNNPTDNTVGGIAGGDVSGNQGNAGTPEVAGEHQELPPDNVIAQGSGTAGGKDILVLGENQSALPNTGVPVASLLALGGGVLLVGLGLLWAARRHGA